MSLLEDAPRMHRKISGNFQEGDRDRDVIAHCGNTSDVNSEVARRSSALRSLEPDTSQNSNALNRVDPVR